MKQVPSPPRSLLSSGSSLPRSPQLHATFCYNSITNPGMSGFLMHPGAEDSAMIQTLSPSPRLGEGEDDPASTIKQNFEPNSVLTAASYPAQPPLSQTPSQPKLFNYKLLGLESRILDLERKLTANQELIKLSEEMVRLKQSERTQDAILTKQQERLTCERVERMEHRLETVERRMEQLQIFTEQRMIELEHKLEQTPKQSEILEIMKSKAEAQALVDAEQKLKETFQARMGELRQESDFRIRKLLKTVEETGDVAQRTEMQLLESKDTVRSLSADYHALLRFMNQFKTRLGYFQWTGEQIKQLKRRQLRIIERLGGAGESESN